MIAFQTLERAKALRRARETPQFVGFITDLIVPDPSTHPRPQAYLVEQSPNWTLPTHFHTQHQFQVFTSGSGALGKHPATRFAIHYASPYSGYGPIVSAERGLSYLTLRLIGDTGAWYLPEARAHLLLRIKKQQVHARPAFDLTAQHLLSLPSATQEVLIAPEASGLAAWLVRVPAQQTVPPPAQTTAHGGRFYVVTQGALQIGAEAVAGLATVFVSSTATLPLQAGAEGLEVLVLQFPLAALDNLERE